MNNRIALGTVQFGMDYGIANTCGKVHSEAAGMVLEYALTKGIDTLDTAIDYGDSEKTLGGIGINCWNVISKLPEIPNNCSNIQCWVEQSVNASLQRLGVKHLYGLLLHRPEQLLENNGDEIYKALQALKQHGLVKNIGVSIYNPSELDYLVKNFKFDIVQAPFNIIDRRLITSGWMDRLSKDNIELHVRSIFLQGLLLMSPTERPAKFTKWSRTFDQYYEWLNTYNLTSLEACLLYVMSYSKIAKIIIGVDGLEQLAQIIDAANGSLPPVPDTFSTDDLDLLNPSQW